MRWVALALVLEMIDAVLGFSGLFTSTVSTIFKALSAAAALIAVTLLCSITPWTDDDERDYGP